MNLKKIFIFCFAIFVCGSIANALTMGELLVKIQDNQTKINDMYAETTTTISSQLTVTGNQKGAQKIIQEGRMWTKGDKSKIEMISPTHQITINNGEKIAIISPDTGQKFVQDLSDKSGSQFGGSSSSQMNLDKAEEYFSLSVTQNASGDYVVTGVPRESNKILGKVEFYVDPSLWLPNKILMYSPQGMLISQSEIKYQKISGIWVPLQNISDVNTPAGSMHIEMEFSNVKVNDGIDDSEFKIE
ncbi:outer membrane lipoprotein carrier protein LolA [Patescibacteria group bacterium]|nr:outer membrane lipoprotein carrier protein LolA [Patescibacteria group bacterium]